jgi:hypothetical protein
VTGELVHCDGGVHAVGAGMPRTPDASEVSPSST